MIVHIYWYFRSSAAHGNPDIWKKKKYFGNFSGKKNFNSLNQPADIDVNCGQIRSGRRWKVFRIEIRQSIIDVAAQRTVRAVFDCVDQSRDKITREGNDQALKFK